MNTILIVVVPVAATLLVAAIATFLIRKHAPLDRPGSSRGEDLIPIIPPPVVADACTVAPASSCDAGASC